MKVLVTGAGGFVGKRLVRRLADAGHEVVATVRADPPAADFHYFESARITTLRIDLADFDSAALPRGVDVVYSLAQSSNFRSFPEKAGDIFAVNVSANMRLLQWAMDNRVGKFVFASSGGIYGARPGGVLRETDPLAVDPPLGFYLGTKLCTEVILQNCRQYFETMAILRPFFIYGPGQRKDMLVARMVESVREGRPIFLRGSDGLLLNPVFVEDAVAAFARALDLEGWHIINVAGSAVVTLREIGEKIGACLGCKPVFEVQQGTPGDYVASTEAAQAKLGMTFTGIDEGIRATVDAHRK
jgi:nucleoside-diphosphate-sugar epimerase